MAVWQVQEAKTRLSEVIEEAADRILGIDTATARLWGELSAQRPRPVIYTLLAATSIVHELTLVTRNTSDVEDIDVKLLNPFTP